MHRLRVNAHSDSSRPPKLVEKPPNRLVGSQIGWQAPKSADFVVPSLYMCISCVIGRLEYDPGLKSSLKKFADLEFFLFFLFRMLSGIAKIGEGVFGEVFKGIQRDGT